MTFFTPRLSLTCKARNQTFQCLRRFFGVFLLVFYVAGIHSHLTTKNVFAQYAYPNAYPYQSSSMNPNGEYRGDYRGEYGEYRGEYRNENSLPINNYVTAVPASMTPGATQQPNSPSYGNPNVFASYGTFPSQTVAGGYLAMGNRPAFRDSNAQKLVPRSPSYDHWSEISGHPWTLQLLPNGLLFPSYLAGMKEPRLGTMWVRDENFKWIWDAALGGRAGLIRFGTPNAVLPEGIQLDLEGAVLLRMDIEHERDMMANDFRAGVPLTFGGRSWQFKTGYYHVSSHMGDHHLIRTGEVRINYVRDAILFAVARRFWGNDWRVYGEAAWAFYTGVETKPWEFQVGVEYAPIHSAMRSRGTPFVAINLHLFQELNYSGYFCCQVGWQWRGACNQMFRLGLQYLNGHDDQFQFHNRTTQKLGFGIWYDF